MKLTRTGNAMQLADRIYGESLNWDALKEIVRYEPEQEVSEGRINNLVGRFAEAHVSQAIRGFVAENPGTFAYRPPHPSVGKNFQISHINGGVYFTRRGKKYSEIDDLVIEGDDKGEIPLVVEVKFRYRSTKGGRGNSKTQNSAMRYNEIQRITRPIIDIFQTSRVGFMLVVPYDKIHKTSEAQRNFRKMGGILVPIRATHNQFKTEMIQEVLKEAQ
jgi:hypothetical protein